MPVGTDLITPLWRGVVILRIVTAAFAIGAIIVHHEGFARPGARRSRADFEVVANVSVIINDDIEQAANAMRPMLALYIGGMGSREQNFYNRLAVRMGYGEAAARIQELFLDRRHRGAVAAVPLDFIEKPALFGPADRVRDRLTAYADAGVTTLSVALYHGPVEQRVEALQDLASAAEAASVL